MLLRDALRALNVFRVRQQIPFVLSVLREYFDRQLSLKQAKRALRAVENFHFVFTAVTSQRSSGGISFMYALHARELRRASKTQQKVAAIDALIVKLRDKLPSYQEFEADFRGILASEKFTKRKALVQYIFGRMTAEYLGGVALEPERMTIEHIADQSQTPGSGLSDLEVAEIGNLLLVTEGLNNAKLKDRPFAQKLEILGATPVWMDDYLRKQTNWTATQIRERTDFLAKLAYAEVWKL